MALAEISGKHMDSTDFQGIFPDLPSAMKFIAATNTFLDRISLEFGMREELSLDMLLAQARNPGAVSKSTTVPPYSRRILFSSESRLYSLVAITWPPGSRTPVHSHYTWCTFMVTQGQLTERRFQLRFGQDGGVSHPRPILSARLCAGDLRTDERFGGVHQLCNEGDATAISLHCYGVEGARSATHVNRVFADAD